MESLTRRSRSLPVVCVSKPRREWATAVTTGRCPETLGSKRSLEGPRWLPPSLPPSLLRCGEREREAYRLHFHFRFVIVLPLPFVFHDVIFFPPPPPYLPLLPAFAWSLEIPFPYLPLLLLPLFAVIIFIVLIFVFITDQTWMIMMRSVFRK